MAIDSYSLRVRTLKITVSSHYESSLKHNSSTRSESLNKALESLGAIPSDTKRIRSSEIWKWCRGLKERKSIHSHVNGLQIVMCFPQNRISVPQDNYYIKYLNNIFRGINLLRSPFPFLCCCLITFSFWKKSKYITHGRINNMKSNFIHKTIDIIFDYIFFWFV